MLKPPLSAMLLAVMAGSALAREPTIAPPPDMAICDAHGWSTDRDPNGLNVRASPTEKAPVVARFVYRPDAVNGSNVQFDIIGFKNGWLLIENGSYGDYGDPEPKQPVYAGKGWISASMVAGQLFGSANRLFAAPSKDAPARKLAKPADEVSVKKVLECRRGWIKLETTEGTGWVGGLCNNQVTTCP
ncbi:MAG: hypothetical protein WB816_12795 [Methylocystis sp.]